MKLSIIIPVFNEEKTIKLVLDKIASINLPCQKEIIVVDDGSTDGTRKEILRYIDIKKLREKIKYIRHKINQGKGAAVRNGVKMASGDYILIQDADLEYNPEEIPKLLSVILACPESVPDPGRVRSSLARMTKNIAVYGSRFKNKTAVIPLLYLWGNRFLTHLTNLLYGTRLTDMETGYKLLPTAFMKRIKLTSCHFDMEPEITAKLVKSGIKIIEVPISYKGRTHLSGKKLTFKDAFGAIITLLRFRF